MSISPPWAPNSCLPYVSSLRSSFTPKSPQTSQLPWGEGPDCGTRPTLQLQKLCEKLKRRTYGHTARVVGEAGGGARSPCSGRAARGSGRKPGGPRSGQPRSAPEQCRRRTDQIAAQTPPSQPPARGRASGWAHVTAHVTAQPGAGLEAATPLSRFEPRPCLGERLPAVQFAAAQWSGPANSESCCRVATFILSSRRAPKDWGSRLQLSGAPAASGTVLGPSPCFSSSNFPRRHWERPH